MSAPRRLVWIAGAVLAFAVALFLAASAIDTTFTVSATTEYARVRAGRMRPPPWHLEDVRFFSAGHGESEKLSGRLELAPGTEIFFERTALGPLKITATHPTTVGNLFPKAAEEAAEADGRPLGTRIALYVDDLSTRATSGRHFIAPFRGSLQVGAPAESDEESAPQLRSANVVLIGHTLLGKGRYQGGSASLEPGDQFEVEDSIDSGAGFVLADERPAMSVNYQAVGRRGKVSRSGAQGYEVSMSALSRVMNDGLIQGTAAAFLAICGWAMKTPLSRKVLSNADWPRRGP